MVGDSRDADPEVLWNVPGDPRPRAFTLGDARQLFIGTVRLSLGAAFKMSIKIERAKNAVVAIEKD